MSDMEADVQASGIRRWYRAHRSAADALLIAALSVVAAGLGFGGVWGVFSLLPDDVSPWWTLVIALPGCALVLIKRRFPLTALSGAAVLFAIDLVTTGGIGPLVVLLDVLWTAVFVASARGRTRLLVAIAVGVVGFFLATLMIAELPASTAFLVALQFGAFVGTDYWWAVAVSQAHELAELHRQRAEQAAAAAEHDRIEAVRRERETMARELHDVVAGHVMAMAIRAEAALSSPADGATDRQALRAVRDAGLDAHGALRSMIGVLRRGDGELAPIPRLSDLPTIVEDARRSGLGIRLACHAQDLADVTEQAIVRIVREGLTNCIRHARGAQVDVVIDERDDDVRVRVTSRGGVASADGYGGGGWGLSMLRERVDALGGRFSAGPDGDGWTVEAFLPREVPA